MYISLIPPTETYFSQKSKLTQSTLLRSIFSHFSYVEKLNSIFNFSGYNMPNVELISMVSNFNPFASLILRKKAKLLILRLEEMSELGWYQTKSMKLFSTSTSRSSLAKIQILQNIYNSRP